MRTIRLIADIPKETDYTKFPDSTIVNETETEEGTWVVREVYGDILTNLYKLVRLAGLVPSNVEDNETNGYQIVEALKKFANSMNDVEQPLQLTGTVWSIALNLAILPNKYICTVRAAADYVSSTSYTLKGNGSGVEEYGFTCPGGFVTGDVLLLVIDTGGARAYNLNASVVPDVFTPFGTPLAFNDGTKVWYESEGTLFSDKPEAYDLQGAIRVLESDSSILIYEMLLIGGYVLCLSFIPGTSTYKLYKFSLSALGTPVLMTFNSHNFSAGTDRKPNLYAAGGTLYISNAANSSANDYAMNYYTLNMAAGTLTYGGVVALDAAFEKTTNAVVSAGLLFTLTAGVLNKYDLGTGVKTYVNTFPGKLGVLFGLGGNAYMSTGDVAKKWIL